MPPSRKGEDATLLIAMKCMATGALSEDARGFNFVECETEAPPEAKGEMSHARLRAWWVVSSHILTLSSAGNLMALLALQAVAPASLHIGVRAMAPGADSGRP